MPEITPPVTANPRRPGTEVELNRHLADTLGTEVEQAMASIDWRSDALPSTAPQADPAEATSTPTDAPAQPQADPAAATPEAPKAGDDPAAQPNSGPTPEYNWDDLRDDKGLIAGKWKTPADAERGVHSLIRLAKSALSERDQAIAKVSEAPQVRQPATPTPVEPERHTAPRAPKRDEVLSTLKEKYDLEPDDLSALVNVVAEEAGMVAEKVVTQKLSEVQTVNKEWADVDTYMRDKFPESVQFADELSLYLETNREVASEVNALINAGNRKGAMRHAWLSYRAEHGDAAAVAQEQKLRAAEQVRKEEVEKARIDAGLISSQASGVHTEAPAGPSHEELEAARSLFRQGVKEPWLRLAIGNQLSGPLFD